MLIDYIIGSKARAAARWLASTTNIKAGLTEAQSKEGTALDVGLERATRLWQAAPGVWVILLFIEFANRMAFSRPELPIRGVDLRWTVIASGVGGLVLSTLGLLVYERTLSLRGSIVDRLRESNAVELKARARELAADGVRYIEEALGKMELRVDHTDALELKRGDIVVPLDGQRELVFIKRSSEDVYVFRNAGTEVEFHTGGGSIWSMVKRAETEKGAVS